MALGRALIQSAGGPDPADQAVEALWPSSPSRGGGRPTVMEARDGQCLRRRRRRREGRRRRLRPPERLLIRIAKGGRAEAAKALAQAGAKASGLRMPPRRPQGSPADSASAEEGYDALKRYARDLTQSARGWRLTGDAARRGNPRPSKSSPANQEQPVLSASLALVRPPSSKPRPADRHMATCPNR